MKHGINEKNRFLDGNALHMGQIDKLCFMIAKKAALGEVHILAQATHTRVIKAGVMVWRHK